MTAGTPEVRAYRKGDDAELSIACDGCGRWHPHRIESRPEMAGALAFVGQAPCDGHTYHFIIWPGQWQPEWAGPDGTITDVYRTQA